MVAEKPIAANGRSRAGALTDRMADEGEPDVEEAAEDPGAMERDVQITILLKAFRGDALPEVDKTLKTARLGDGEEGEGEEGGGDGEGGGEGEEPPPLPPTLEEMDVRFNLTLFNGESLQSEQLTFIKPPPEEEGGEEDEGGAAANGGEEGQDGKPPVLVWKYPDPIEQRACLLHMLLPLSHKHKHKHTQRVRGVSSLVHIERETESRGIQPRVQIHSTTAITT